MDGRSPWHRSPPASAGGFDNAAHSAAPQRDRRSRAATHSAGYTQSARTGGFRLRRLDDEPKAGVIDNRLRVEIRRSRLLIADFTIDNRGAIWEAGFAEGLGLPVIYTCKKSKLDGKHFDIRNCQMVLWDLANPGDAEASPKATIRNTLPDEAILEDEIFQEN